MELRGVGDLGCGTGEDVRALAGWCFSMPSHRENPHTRDETAALVYPSARLKLSSKLHA
jgi:hypothetical protein